jgi:Sec7-like guanine-nucleotide exchange factor
VVVQREETLAEKAAKQFNSKPTAGITFLLENHITKDDPASIAKFLLQTPKIDKAAMGDYLSER